jgi:hypothetical protein
VTPTTQTFLRRAAVLTAAAVTPLMLAAPAGADVPEGWSDPEPVSGMHALLVLGGVPLLLFALIVLAVYVPAMVRGERVAPGAATPEDQWFGGPRSGTHELKSGSDTEGTGGASGRW